MGTTTAAVNSALQRARELVEERLPEQTQQANMRSLGDERLRGLVERYSKALERGDVDALLAMLTEDATWSMPPEPTWYGAGTRSPASSWKGRSRSGGAIARSSANGQPAVGCYAWDDASGSYVARVLDVLTLRGEQIAGVTAFLAPEIFESFGLPSEL